MYVATEDRKLLEVTLLPRKGMILVETVSLVLGAAGTEGTEVF